MIVYVGWSSERSDLHPGPRVSIGCDDDQGIYNTSVGGRGARQSASGGVPSMAEHLLRAGRTPW